MIEAIAATLIDSLIKKKLIISEDREYCVYCLTCRVEKYLSIFIILLSGLLCDGIFGIAGGCIYCLFFRCLRRYTGGYHAKTFQQCLLLSSSAFLSIIAVIKFTDVNTCIYVMLLFISAVIIMVFAPVYNKNFPVSREDFIYHKRQTHKWVVIETIISLLVVIFDYYSKIKFYCILSFCAIAFFIIIAKIFKQEVKIFEDKK